MLSSLDFGSFLVYSPRALGTAGAKSKEFTLSLKEERLAGRPPVPAAHFLARRMRELQATEVLSDLLHPGAVLVPIPRSGLHEGKAPWPARALADALMANGFGKTVAAVLRRAEPVIKAATAGKGQRPPPQEHLRTLEVTTALGLGNDIVLVDDVVTSGSQLLGAASALSPMLPGATIRGFAAVRTLSAEPVDDMVAPCVGTITLVGQRTRREP